MEAGFVALMALVLFIGVVIGVFVGRSLAKRKYLRDTKFTQGTLNVDYSESELEPGLFLGLGVLINDISSRKYVVLDVNVIGKNSHE